MQIAVAALLEDLLPRVDQMDSHVYNEYKWKARIFSLSLSLTHERMWLCAFYARSGDFGDVTGQEITRRKMQPKLCKRNANPGAPWR